MEFWGVEVKSGELLKVQPGDDKILHLSQASLGEVKKDKGNESIPLFVQVGGQKLVLGTLSTEKCLHISFDLVFEKEFELSHNWKNGSVFFCGYKSVISDDANDFTDSDSELEPDLSLFTRNNGKPESKDEQTKPTTNKVTAAKPDSSATKPKVKIVEPPKESKSKEEDDSDSDEDDDNSDDESDGDEDMLEAADGSSEDDEESSDEDDEDKPKKAEPGKKRPIESTPKTPASGKKAKFITPQKTDGKKVSAHIATPYPSKQAGKTPANTDKSKQQTPKSSAQVTCKSCTKSFNSENALQSHTKAKHEGK